MISAWDVTPNVQSLNLNQTETGTLITPLSVDEWNFAAAAGTQVQFNLEGISTTGVEFTLTGPAGYVAFSDSTASSGLINLPNSGTYTLTVQATGDTVASYSFEMAQTTVTPLALASAYNGTFVDSGQAQLFAVQMAITEPLTISLVDPSLSDQTELYARFGSAPTRADFDYGQSSSGSSHSITVPDADAGAWYVLVYAASVSAAPSPFSIAATSSPLLVTSVTPNHSANGSVVLPAPTGFVFEGAAGGDPGVQVTLTVSGAGFDQTTMVSLVAAGGDVYPTTTTFDTPTQLTATFFSQSGSGYVAPPPPGTYSVLLTRGKGGQAELPDSFTLDNETVPEYEPDPDATFIRAKLVVPSVVGRHESSTFYVECTNNSDIALPAPLLILESAVADDEPLFTLDSSLVVSGFWTSALPVGYSNMAEILASGKVPGWLGPGETVTVPVYYAGMEMPWNLSETQFKFQIQVVTPTTQGTANWSSVQSSLQPPGISGAAWNAIYEGLTAELGSTPGGYAQFLDNEASYLGQLGENITDVSQLWNFAVQQADNSLSPIGPYLANVTDDSVAMPGSLSLSFSRVFAESIAGRDTMGPLGMGWSTSWETSARVASDGTVTITDLAGTQEIFEPDSRTPGTYFSEPGDANTLTGDGLGGYLLTQRDGTITDFSANGTLNDMQDADGNRITAGYTNGLLTSLTASSGQSITISYNSAGLISSVADSEGRTTTYTYDSTDTYLIAVTGYNGETTTYTNNTAGGPAQNALTEIAFPAGTHQYFTYDGEGRLASTSSDGGAEPFTFAYNAGEVDFADGLGDTIKFFYNGQGLLVKTVDPLGNVTLGSYNSNGNLVQLTNAVGQSETLTYNAVGEVTSMTDFLGDTTRFAYNGPFNSLTSMTDANGNTTRYTYDSKGDLLATTYANNTTKTFTYDPEGDATSFVNPDGDPITAMYNSAGQVTSDDLL